MLEKIPGPETSINSCYVNLEARLTPQEILGKQAADISTNSWLREIAYQLAVANDRAAPVDPPVEPVEVKRGPGRPRKNDAPHSH